MFVLSVLERILKRAKINVISLISGLPMMLVKKDFKPAGSAVGSATDALFNMQLEAEDKTLLEKELTTELKNALPTDSRYSMEVVMDESETTQELILIITRKKPEVPTLAN